MENLRKYLEDRDVFYYGCGVLRNLAFNAAENQSKFGEAGICPLLVEILRKYIGDRDVIDQGCGALMNLALNAENKSKFGEAGICPLLVEISVLFSSDTGLTMILDEFSS